MIVISIIQVEVEEEEGSSKKLGPQDDRKLGEVVEEVSINYLLAGIP